jgi:hypothetical protein
MGRWHSTTASSFLLRIPRAQATLASKRVLNIVETTAYLYDTLLCHLWASMKQDKLTFVLLVMLENPCNGKSPQSTNVALSLKRRCAALNINGVQRKPLQ